MNYIIHPTKDGATVIFSKKAKELPISKDVIEVMTELNETLLLLGLVVDGKDELSKWSDGFYKRTMKRSNEKSKKKWRKILSIEGGQGKKQSVNK